MDENYNYSGLYVSVYPLGFTNDQEKPLTGTAPSEGNDHITLAYFGKRKANEMKNHNVKLINAANTWFMNKVATVEYAYVNSFELEVKGEMKTRHDVLYVIDENTSNMMDQFHSRVPQAFARKYPFHISQGYYWTAEEAEKQKNKAMEMCPFRVRLGAAYDD